MRNEGHIHQRGNRYFVVIDLGKRPAQRCTPCRKRYWVEGDKRLEACARCGGVVEDKELRRQAWYGPYDAETAKRQRRDLLGKRDRGTFVDPTKISVADFLTEWLEHERASLRPATWESYARNIRHHVIPKIGSVRLQQLKPARLSALYADLLSTGRRNNGGGGLKPRTVRYIHTIIRKALAQAVEWEYLSRNPADGAKAPRAKLTRPPEVKAWDAQELGTFLRHVEGDRLYAAWFLTATTGMRRGEILGLRWRDVGLDGERLSVRQTLVTVGYEVRISEPKTDKGRRVVDLDPQTVAILREHRRRQLEERMALGAAYQDSGLVFAREDGRPIHPDEFSKAFKRHAQAAGLPTLSVHGLRHTWASLALTAGVHPKVVSERLGHANIGVTLDTYSHLLPTMGREAAATVADAIFGK